MVDCRLDWGTLHFACAVTLHWHLPEVTPNRTPTKEQQATALRVCDENASAEVPQKVVNVPNHQAAPTKG